MKSTKRLLSVVLVVLVICGAFFAIPATVSAAREACKTRDEAVNWLRQQDGATYDFGNFYDDSGHLWGGTQCVEFVRAYVNWLVNGNAWQDAWGRATGNGDNIWKNTLWSELGWTVYTNSADFMPQPGDIFSSGTNKVSHTGVVISSDLNTAVIADSNARNTNPYDGDSVYVHSINWRSASSDSAYGATHYIRPVFKSSTPVVQEPTNPPLSEKNPIGSVEVIESTSAGTIHVRGWAYDRDYVGAYLNIHVYVGGRAGETGSEFHSIKADDYCDKLKGNELHGFDRVIKVDKKGTQKVYLYAINVGEGNDNPLIGEGTVNINANPKFENLGEFFIARIATTDGKYELYDDGRIYYDTPEKGTVFNFIRQSDGFYHIQNNSTNEYLSYSDYQAPSTFTFPENPIISCDIYDDSEYFKWGIEKYQNGYNIVPYNDNSLNIGLNDNDKEAQLFPRNNEKSQILNIKKIETSGTINGISFNYDYNTCTMSFSGNGMISNSTKWSFFSPYIKVIIMREGITGVDGNPFNSVVNVEQVSFPETYVNGDLKKYNTTKWYRNLPNGEVYANRCLIGYKGNDEREFIIKEGTVSVSNYANIGRIKSISFPNTLKSIGSQAFYPSGSGQNSLVADIIIPEGVESIGDFAFWSCSHIKKITIPKSITYIGKYAVGYFGSGATQKAELEIYGYRDTLAESYALENGFRFIDIEEEQTTNIQTHSEPSIPTNPTISPESTEPEESQIDQEKEQAETQPLTDKPKEPTETQLTKIDISDWTVEGLKNVEYTGKVIKQEIDVVSYDYEYADFTVKYKGNKKVGTATVIITGTGDYTGTITTTFKITKANNPIKVTAKKTVTANAKKKTTIKKAITVKNAQGKVTYKTNNKKVTVKKGNLIVAKGFKKGKTIKVKITITAKGNSNYKLKKIVKTVSIKFK